MCSHATLFGLCLIVAINLGTMCADCRHVNYIHISDRLRRDKGIVSDYDQPFEYDLTIPRCVEPRNVNSGKMEYC